MHVEKEDLNIRTVRTLGHIRTKDTSGVVGEEDFGVNVGSDTLEIGVVGGVQRRDIAGLERGG